MPSEMNGDDRALYEWVCAILFGLHEFKALCQSAAPSMASIVFAIARRLGTSCLVRNIVLDLTAVFFNVHKCHVSKQALLARSVSSALVFENCLLPGPAL